MISCDDSKFEFSTREVLASELNPNNIPKTGINFPKNAVINESEHSQHLWQKNKRISIASKDYLISWMKCNLCNYTNIQAWKLFTLAGYNEFIVQICCNNWIKYSASTTSLKRTAIVFAEYFLFSCIYLKRPSKNKCWLLAWSFAITLRWSPSSLRLWQAVRPPALIDRKIHCAKNVSFILLQALKAH